ILVPKMKERLPCKLRVKGKNGHVCMQAKWPIRPALISSFCSMKWLGVFLPPGWDASPSQGYPPALNSPIPIYKKNVPFQQDKQFLCHDHSKEAECQTKNQ
ncbi:MAG: hypothetical protein N4A46_15650, partial [Schleiferiaceae bacterium]|nr:hypothetical protein [Schleiferiaceae bacterium]